MKPENIFPACHSFLSQDQWQLLFPFPDQAISTAVIENSLHSLARSENTPAFLPDLFRLEYAYFKARENGCPAIAENVEEVLINPTLKLVRLDWQNLVSALDASARPSRFAPVQGEEFVLLYTDPKSKKIRIRPALKTDLLALKIIAEELDPAEVAREENVAVGHIDRAMDLAARRGILLKPGSLIRRDPLSFPVGENIPQEFFSSPVFTLQWHVTQVCDLHCKHCYDRSDRVALEYERGVGILDDLRSFCLGHNVRGQVSFSGGNPLLYPDFLDLYKAAVERNLMAAILGNPASRQMMEQIVSIKKPVFFQVSLEGLPDHNDYIRGSGHFKRVMTFLDLLKDLGIYSMVMLTLTRDNMAQVLPLAEKLRDRVDLFTFNRLAMVGEGASLKSVNGEEYQLFLQEYLAAAAENPVMSLKDNLLNIVRVRQGQPVFGGCAGHGCGAAFNFFSILPDGEAHACRKLPSPIGNIFEQSISEIYHGTRAQQYRAGSSACSSCSIRPVCGGCLAVVHGYGLDVFTDKDPCCFF